MYIPPVMRVYESRLEHMLTVSAVVPGATISDAEEEEWTVS